MPHTMTQGRWFTRYMNIISQTVQHMRGVCESTVLFSVQTQSRTKYMHISQVLINDWHNETSSGLHSI